MDALIITRFCIQLPYVYKEKMNYNDINKINYRLALLEKFTLPSILLQSDKNFKWIILIDKRQPLLVRKKIEFIATKYDNIYYKYHNGEDISNMEYYEEYLDKNNKDIITMRLDADDAII